MDFLSAQLKNPLLDAQVNEYDKKTIYNVKFICAPQDKINPTLTASPPLYSLQLFHPLSLVPRNHRNTLAITEHTAQGDSFPRSPVSHITLQQSNIDGIYEQIIEQAHIIIFRSQNNHLFSTR